MSLLEQQNFLARLYTDADLRRSFLAEPEKIGLENDLTAGEISELARVMPEELNFFAESLFWKRLREVEKILPQTKENLPDKFDAMFQAFSKDFNPQSVRKHLEDAYHFADYLLKQEIGEFAKEIINFEQAKLEFFAFEKNLVWRVFRHNFQTKYKTRIFRLNLWLRIGKRKIIL